MFTSTLMHSVVWNQLETMRSSHPPTGIRKPVPQVWTSPMPSWGTGGGPGTGLVWLRCLHKTFTHQLTSSFLSSSSRSSLYKSRSRCRGIATKHCGMCTDRTPATYASASKGTRAQFKFGLTREPRVQRNRGWSKSTHWLFPRLPWPDRGLVWPWHLNTPFTHQLTSSFLAGAVSYQHHQFFIPSFSSKVTNILFENSREIGTDCYQ